MIKKGEAVIDTDTGQFHGDIGIVKEVNGETAQVLWITGKYKNILFGAEGIRHLKPLEGKEKEGVFLYMI